MSGRLLVNAERYKKSAEHMQAMFKINPVLPSEAKYLIFKRWDVLYEKDRPQVVFFLCKPDVLSGLHGLANILENIRKRLGPEE